MATESDPVTTRVTVVLDKPSDWHNWLFIRQDAAQRNGLWQYVNPDIAADQLPELNEPVEPRLADYGGAETLGSLSATDRESFKWDYERFEKRYAEWSKKSRALADFNSEISKTVAKRHLYLIWSKSTPYQRLVTLKQHLAPTDATRRRELIGRYAALQTPARGKKVGDWLSSWVDVTNQCKELRLPETTGTRAQEDFLVACKAIDPEWATACLREVYKKEANLRRTKPISTGLSTMASELEVATPTETSSNPPTEGARKKEQPRCACGLKHKWVDCWILNPEHPRRPNSYTPKPSLVEKVKAARKKDPRLDESIDQALASWREKNGVTVSVNLDDGKPPSNPTSNAVTHLAHKDEAIRTEAVLDDDQQPCRTLQVLAEGATDELADRWILDPGSNTHVINSEAWNGWVREREAGANETIGAGTGRIRITAWGRVTVMANTPRGVESLVLTHVALVEGFITSVIGLARCRAIGVHFDSGRDRLYRVSPQTVVANLEYNGGHWLVDADPTKRPLRSQLRSLSTSHHRPSMAAKVDQQVSAETAHLIWGHPGQKVIDKLETNVVGVQIVGQQSAETCSVCTEAKLTRQIARRPQDDYAQRPFYRVALDLIQLLPTGEACLNDDKYAGHLVDQASKWHEVETFPNRSRPILSSWLIRSIRKIQRVFDSDISALRMDNEPGFGSFAEDVCSDLGIRYEPSTEYTPEQNGLAERAGKQLVIRARAMRLHANLPESLSHELVRTAAYVLNRTPTEVLNWRTPYEVVQPNAEARRQAEISSANRPLSRLRFHEYLEDLAADKRRGNTDARRRI